LSESQRKRIPSQKLMGMQVVDTKGAIIGSVKDFSISISDKEILLTVGTKAGEDIEVPLSGVSSVEDVILLGRPREVGTAPTAPSPPPAPATITCRSCGANLPAHAKFCAKCGSQVK
jgi:sporulation protein YlmC with PRC-barrel domain